MNGDSQRTGERSRRALRPQLKLLFDLLSPEGKYLFELRAQNELVAVKSEDHGEEYVACVFNSPKCNVHSDEFFCLNVSPLAVCEILR